METMTTHLKSTEKLFLLPVRYMIPDFQRNYIWKKEDQWEPLWNDVEQLADSPQQSNFKTKPHFMGAIVIKPSSDTGQINRPIVVDGQQRLITLQLLIDAMQKFLDRQEYSEEAGRLVALVKNPDVYLFGEADNTFKVWPTIADRVDFQHVMSNDSSSVCYSESQIAKAHDYFKEKITQWFKKFPDKSDRKEAAKNLENVVREKLQFVVIDLGILDDSHIIFETLNARGTPLHQSDMVKNKILHDAKIGVSEGNDGSTSSEMNRLWPFRGEWWSEDVGRGLQRRPRIDVYLNHWLTLRNREETKPHHEFNVFTKYIEKCKEGGTAINNVVMDMSEIGKTYSKVEKAQQADIKKFIERRNVMNVGVITPLLLWLLSENLSSITLSNCIKALESFLVRRVVCGHSARGYGKFFVELIAKLADNTADHADRIVVSHLADQTAQSTVWPTDNQLREHLINTPLYKILPPGRLMMLLSGIEEKLRSTNMAENGELPRNLQIEHIMPRAWEEHWPLENGVANETADQRERAIHTIGNLTLVSGKLNSSLSNAPWNRKKQILADHSIMFLNKELVNDGPLDWNEAEINKRANWLCGLAIKVWPHQEGCM